MLCLQTQALIAKLYTLMLDRQLTHKLMSDEGVAFCKKIVQVKREPTFAEMLEIIRDNETDKTIMR